MTKDFWAFLCHFLVLLKCLTIWYLALRISFTFLRSSFSFLETCYFLFASIRSYLSSYNRILNFKSFLRSSILYSNFLRFKALFPVAFARYDVPFFHGCPLLFRPIILFLVVAETSMAVKTLSFSGSINFSCISPANIWSLTYIPIWLSGSGLSSLL